MFKVTDKKGLLSSSVTKYNIKLFLQDSNTINLSNKTYLIYFDLNNTNSSSKEKSKNNSESIGSSDSF
jgi:hypothetical protein